MGIFSGLSSLEKLDLGGNRLSNLLPTNIFSDLSSLRWLNLSFNQLSSLPVGIFSGLSSLDLLNLSYNSLGNLPTELFSDLSSLQTLALSSNDLTGLPSDVFSGVPSLRSLSLSRNALSGLPAGLFSGLSSLRSLYLGDNTVDLSVPVLLRQVTENEFQATAPTGAPFNIVLPLGITNGSIDSGANTITISAGKIDSDPIAVTRAPGAAAAIALDIVTLPEVPRGHYGYHLVESSPFGRDDDSLVFALGVPIPGYEPTVNHAPVFTEGSQTTRSIAENTLAGVNIGAPVTATDEDGDPLTYKLQGTDAAAFGILGTTGQLRTRTPLDYETRDTYTVTVMVSDGRGGTDTIGVTISVTDEAEGAPDPEPVVEETVVPPPVETTPNRDPVFANDRATRSIAENTEAGTNIGAPVSATDADGDTLTYTLGGIDASSFTIVGTTGQLKTRAPLDYETKNAYIVIVTASDGSRTDTITVIITVLDVDETTFGGGRETRSIAENTPAGVNIGAPVSATNMDSEDVLIYSLEGPDAAAFTIIGTTGQLKTRAPLDYETKNTYTLTVIVTDGTLTASIIVTITITDVAESPPPAPIEGGVSISEIMYGADDFLNTFPQWIELHNATTEVISLKGGQF